MAVASTHLGRNRQGRKRCRRVVAALAAAIAVTIGLALPAAATPAVRAGNWAATGPSAGAQVPTSLLLQRLTWSECYPGMGVATVQCAGVTVPLDWNHPAGATISIKISRIKAANPAKRLGVLFTNPGGPGAPGLDLPLFIPDSDPSIAAAYDLIGIDQRGVGASAPSLECADPSILGRAASIDGRDTSSANQAEIKTLDQQYAAQCSANPLTPYIQDSQTVHDFDLVRQLLHENKINYLGFSGGTQLGAWYAAVFPKHVGRFVLDGNLDWTSPSYQSFNRQAKGFQTNFNNFLEPWIAKYNAEYHLGSTASAVDRAYERRRAALAKHPMALIDGSVLTAAGYDGAIAGALYDTSDYPELAEALSALEHYSKATRNEKFLVAGVFSDSFGEPEDPFYAIVCQDDASQTYQQVVAETNQFRTRYPLTGAGWNVDPCPFFTLPVQGSPVVGSKLPPMLMLNNDNDPATPLQSAQIARSRTPNARLVTVRNQAGHTIYGEGDSCADGYANRYLLTGVLPARDVSCAGIGLPKPDSSDSSDDDDDDDGVTLTARHLTPLHLFAAHRVPRAR